MAGLHRTGAMGGWGWDGDGDADGDGMGMGMGMGWGWDDGPQELLVVTMVS